MRVHQRVDLERWTREFSLEKLRAWSRAQAERRQREHPEELPDEAAVQRQAELVMPGPRAITSPLHLAVIEQLRAQAGFAPQSRPGGTPVDVAIFSLGEAPHRATTKFGGLPFLPRSGSWPKRRGAPLPFLGQLCFSDSTELFREPLPGDVLLVFGELEAIMMGERDGAAFEWVDLDARDPIAAEQVPDTAKVLPCHAALHRTYDWPVTMDEELLTRMEATKIGGLPVFLQGEPDGLRQDDHFLGTLGAVQPAADHEYPWLNQREPIPLERLHEVTSIAFMVGDMGNLNLFLRDGEVIWDSASF